MGLGTARGDSREDQGVSKGRGGKEVQVEHQGRHCAGGPGEGVGEWQGREGDRRGELSLRRAPPSPTGRGGRGGSPSRPPGLDAAGYPSRRWRREYTPVHPPPPSCARSAQAPIYNRRTSEENDLRGSVPAWDTQLGSGGVRIQPRPSAATRGLMPGHPPTHLPEHLEPPYSTLRSVTLLKYVNEYWGHRSPLLQHSWHCSAPSPRL